MNAHPHRREMGCPAGAVSRSQGKGLLALLCLAAATLTGCGTNKEPTHWLALPLPREAVPLETLTSVPASPTSGQTADASAQRPVLTVRRIALPEYLQSNTVRFRQTDSTLAEWPDARWADRLEVGLTDHLVMRLRRHLPDWTVCERHCPATPGAVSLNVEFAPLDYVRPARELRAEARWQFTQRDHGAPADGKAAPARLPLHRTADGMKAFVLRVDRDDARGQVAAMGELLDDLSGDLARAVRVWK